MPNIKITPEELAFIRTLQDFDLTMVLSEIHDHSWFHARILLREIQDLYLGRTNPNPSKSK